jgi:hypothetical protein
MEDEVDEWIIFPLVFWRRRCGLIGWFVGGRYEGMMEMME